MKIAVLLRSHKTLTGGDVLSNTPAKCEVDQMNSCRDNRRTDRKTDRQTDQKDRQKDRQRFLAFIVRLTYNV